MWSSNDPSFYYSLSRDLRSATTVVSSLFRCYSSADTSAVLRITYSAGFSRRAYSKGFFDLPAKETGSCLAPPSSQV